MEAETPRSAVEGQSGSSPRSRLEAAFRQGRPALVVYLMAGYPDRATSLDAILAAAEAGADVIELGVPYGDPLADGPVIAEAGQVARAAQGGFGLAESIAVAAEFALTWGRPTPPVVLMCYLNPLVRLGFAEAARRMRDAGIAGVIVPDMPPEAARPWRAVSDGVDTVFLAAPTSTPERLRAVGDASSGFVYCASTLGVTGERERLSEGARDLVKRARAATDLPVAIGFGISNAEQAREAASFADGVIVGSAVVRRQREPAAVRAFVAELAAAVREARR